MAAVVEPRLPVTPWAGRQLWSTLALIGIPVSVVFAFSLTGDGAPAAVLYGVSGILGAILAIGAVYRSEWLIATAVLYMPLSKQIPANIGPGINGPNVLLLLLLLAWIVNSIRNRRGLIEGVRYGKLMTVYAFLSLISVWVLLQNPVGRDYFWADGITELKGWLDQFVLFLALGSLISNGAIARRVVVYCVLGTLVAQAYGFLEYLDVGEASSIDDARLLGPAGQPNDFGAFIVYNISPIIAYAVLNVWKIRTWLLIPYFLLTLRLLLATFSRGAYIGLMMASGAATYFRGKLFFAAVLVASGILLWNYPQLVPDSVRDRFGATTTGYNSPDLDKSSNSRLILWEAAIEMTAERPLSGHGFVSFRLLKSQYTDVPVEESDPHNQYLYVASQLGLPALLVFLALLYGFYRSSLLVYRFGPDMSSRVIGLGGLTMLAGVVTINMFGSRMVNSEVSGYFWVYFAVLISLLREWETAIREKAEGSDDDDSSVKQRKHRPTATKRGHERARR